MSTHSKEILSKSKFFNSGTDINVPPPTLTNTNYPALGPNEEDDGQYREDPSIYYKDDRYNSKPTAPAYAPRPAPVQYNPAPQQYYQNNVGQAPAPVYQQPQQQQQQHRFQPQPQYYQQPQPQQRADYWHPNAKVDINTGSYSLSYGG